MYIIPKPHNVLAVMLPPRSYQTFTRIGRVLERMFEYGDQNKMWSITFRDSEYMGDFHTSFLTTLRRCPQICSVSFVSTQRVEEDALLGHLVGQIPPTVRFLSFKSTLSRESIQALCFLAGANSIFYGEKLLTTGNPDVERDQALFAKLGIRPMETQRGA